MTWKWTLEEALLNIRSLRDTMATQNYITTLQNYKDAEVFDGKNVDIKVLELFKDRMKIIFDQLSFEDQIEISRMYPAFFYRFLDVTQQTAWKLMS